MIPIQTNSAFAHPLCFSFLTLSLLIIYLCIDGPPMVNVLPPTPQHSTLTQAGTVHKPNSREPTMMERTEEESVNVDDGKVFCKCLMLILAMQLH